jgi:hypothetical protein
MAEQAPEATPQRIYFREFTEGDEKKRQARSNISQSGGGARDIRMPHRAFGPLMEKMLPSRRHVRRKRNDQPVMLEIYSGTLHYPVDPREPQGRESTMTIDYEPPTTARGAEGRIPRIPRIPSLQNVPDGTLGKTFLLLVQNSRGELRAHYVTEDDLHREGWDPTVVNTILNCAQAKKGNRVIQGYIDFTSTPTRRYCHG